MCAAPRPARARRICCAPTALVNEVHGVLLSGGSAFGLAAATGVVRYLEGKGVGLQFAGATIPIVPAAILFDLGACQGGCKTYGRGR